MNDVFIAKKHNDTKIMIHMDEEAWNIYYSKPGYPFLFAFGVSPDLTPDDVFKVAIANTDDYKDLFE